LLKSMTRPTAGLDKLNKTDRFRVAFNNPPACYNRMFLLQSLTMPRSSVGSAFQGDMRTMPEEGDDRGFKVEDKRRFDSSGQPRSEGEPREESEESADATPEPVAGRERPAGHGRASAAGEGELGFSSFIVGLASQAFMFLGSTPDPSSGVVHKDLPQAAAMIDILSMLQSKTVGNLSEDEAHLIEEVLYELRMRYVSETQHGAPEQPGAVGEKNEG
jgi:hypothetical protein